MDIISVRSISEPTPPLVALQRPYSHVCGLRHFRDCATIASVRARLVVSLHCSASGCGVSDPELGDSGASLYNEADARSWVDLIARMAVTAARAERYRLHLADTRPLQYQIEGS